MFRKLLVVCVLLLSACATYPDARYGARQPVYSDGSYYSPSAEGYGDYYHAPESSGYYDDYYDNYYYDSYYSGRYRSPFYMSGQSAWCTYGYRTGYVYRPCSYGYGYGRPHGGWGLSLFFGDRWGWGGGWSNYWPYHHRHHRHDRDRDYGPRQPRSPSNGDRNRRSVDEGMRIQQRIDSNREPPLRTRPIPGNRNERPRDERPVFERPVFERRVSGQPPLVDRNVGAIRLVPPRPREDGNTGVRGPGGLSRNVAPARPNYPVMRNEPRPTPVAPPRREEPAPRADRNERTRDDDDRPEPRSRPRLQ